MPTYTIRDNKTNEIRNGRTFHDYYNACDELSAIGVNWQRNWYLYNEGWREQQPAPLDLTDFGFEPIKDHYLLIDEGSSTDSVFVTYFADEFQGAKNRRTSPTKLGRYLKQFYPHLTDDDVTTQSSTIFTKLLKVELQLAYTADDIQAIYEEGHTGALNSCMSHRMDSGHWSYGWMKHPTRAYAGPDLALAYIRDANGILIGRSVVWPEKKYYGSVYGNYDKMRAALVQAGYRDHELNGARMSRIELRRSGSEVTLLAPYLDGCNVCYDDGEYLVIGSHDELGRIGTSTSGYISVTEYRCAITNKKINRNRALEVLHPATGAYVFIDRELSDDNTERLHGNRWLKTTNDADYTVIGDGKRIPKGVIQTYYRLCAVTQQYYLSSEGINTSDGWVCHKVFYTDYVVCQASRTILKKTQAKWMEHGAWWHPQMLRDNGVTIDGKNYANVLQTLAA
ncbi:MAG: hypothetical protein EOQ39_18585 [Mesorhizobium sp.]|uniref:hypothetical protein n=1 Tax=Mesorhizobium sp. TaxID=1871066 RepID=UPI000FE9DC39|nr:hypothetical protein [Mesorhizobium sp.]RWB08822.1 MAG: hypothetical protein EOQ37_04760 [Mesorhizobium sp.]RWB13528.1 MAG: hypothetical protein EOQ39_18585 [Mesorhizobium sp.]